MELQVGVKILLQNPEGKFLVLLRNPQTYPDAGETWDIPGGRILPGLGLLDNLKREIQEETQLDYTEEPKLISAQDIFAHKSTDKNLHQPAERHVVRLTYLGTITGEPVINQQEHLQYKWLSLAEIKKLPNLDKYLKEILLMLI
jgi:8-oxo-dGTP pyrophosphatase MutT (NUDIX family)